MLMRNLFEALEDLNMFTLKFYVVDHVVQELTRFGSLD